MFLIFVVEIVENLPPSELKKLRNKQRKAKKKAELQCQQAAQAQVKKEQHNKSRQQHNHDGDPEAPQLDELVPEKLARPEEPLEKAIEFLRPLQILAKDYIQTHLMAFEIYYRKNKLLLMLQSLKRARNIDAENPVLASCILRFNTVLNATKDIHPYVKSVIDKEVVDIFKGKSFKELKADILAKHGRSLYHVLEVAKVMYKTDSSTKAIAVKLATSTDMDGIDLQVSFRRTVF